MADADLHFLVTIGGFFISFLLLMILLELRWQGRKQTEENRLLIMALFRIARRKEQQDAVLAGENRRLALPEQSTLFGSETEACSEKDPYEKK